MDLLTKKKISKIISLLNIEQKKEKILEVDINSNSDLIKFLENDGGLMVDYKVNYSLQKNLKKDISGKVNLWYRDINGKWKINIYRINQLFTFLTIFIFFSSCSKNDTISVENSNIENATIDQINKLPLTNYYVDNYYYNIITSTHPKLLNSDNDSSFYKPLETKKKITVVDRDGIITKIDEDKFKTVEEQRKEKVEMIKGIQKLASDYEKDGKKKDEKEKDSLRKIFALIPKTAIIGHISLKNNTSQNLEYAKITSVITYTFPNEKFYYSFPLEILKNDEIWKIDESENIEVPNVFNIAYEYYKFQKILNKHKPQKIILEYYIAYSNTIGLKNYRKDFLYEKFAVPKRSIALEYGAFHTFPFTEKYRTMLGEKIFEKNITELLNK